MALTAATVGWQQRFTTPVAVAATWVFGLGLGLLVALMPAVSMTRMAIILPVLVLEAVIVLGNPEGALPIVFGWFILLGAARRVLSDGMGSFPSFDPLLIVAALPVVLMLPLAVRRGGLRDRTPLSSAVLALNVLAVVGIVNPLQGGPSVGLAGLFFFLLPTLWFWVGRGMSDDERLGQVLRVFAGLSAPVAIYGLFQSFGHFPVWDRAWAASVGPKYLAIYVNGVLRPFGTFASASEYGTFLAVALVISLVGVLASGRRWRLLRLLTAGLLGAGLFLSSLRGAAMLTIIALAVAWAARRGARLVRLTAYGAVAIFGLVLLTGWLAGGNAGTKAGTASLISHQVQGLANPLNSKTSTLQGHLHVVEAALAQSIRNPVGYGTGVARKTPGDSTGASSQSGGGRGSEFLRSADADPGNVSIAWGLAGLAAYVVLTITALSRAYRRARDRRDWISLTVLALLVAVLFRWFSDMYAVVPLVWLSLGWLDRPVPASLLVDSTERAHHERLPPRRSPGLDLDGH